MADRTLVLGLLTLGALAARAVSRGSIEIWAVDGERRLFLPALLAADRSIVVAAEELAARG